jgi:hypothetical protein
LMDCFESIVDGIQGSFMNFPPNKNIGFHSLYMFISVYTGMLT